MNYMDFVKPLFVVLFCLVARNICDLKTTKIKFILWTAVVYILVGIAANVGYIIGGAVMLIMISMMIYKSENNLAIGIIGAMHTIIIVIVCKAYSRTVLSGIYSNTYSYNLIIADFSTYISVLVLSLLLCYGLSKIIGEILHRKLKIKSVGRVNNSLIVLFFAVTVLVFLFVIITSLLKNTRDNPALLVTYFAFLAFMMIFTYFVYSSTVKDSRINKGKTELKQLNEYTANIESMCEGISSTRHDYANVISSIAGYIQDDDMEGLKKYFNEKIIPFSSKAEAVNTTFSVLSNIKEYGLKGIVAVKLICAQENNISVIVDIKDEIYIESVAVSDLVRVVGSLLDNACEASLECDKPYINVALIKDKNITSIVIINSIKDKNINIKKIFERGFSTKGVDRGYGLSNVVYILDKYPNVLLDTAVEENEFKQIIHIEEDGRNNAECIHL